jgi:glutamine---fructose-6-phosphate transaminase (isomerizing)
MCGIVGYVGNKEALPILIEGLKALEYRGYDSAGVAILSPGKIESTKRVGQVSVLEKAVQGKHLEGLAGIAHTRWATHGAPTEANAHPHRDCTGRIFVAHNGIIENYRELREYLSGRGHTFVSETDTEVVPHLIEDFLKNGADFKTALFDSLHMIRGAYAFAIIDFEQPGTIYAARFSSPLVVGVGQGERFLASDPAALAGKTRDIIYLKDGQVAQITENQVFITDLEQHTAPVEVTRLEWSLEQAQKGNFAHFMLKEIFEGPEVVRSALRGRLRAEENLIKLGGLEAVREKLKGVKRLIILACGTSYYAGLVGECFFEEIAGIPTEVHIASEFRYREQPFDPGTVALAISQSGETADTLAALRKAKEHGLLTLGLVNVVGSTIARETDAGVYNHAGPEIGVASTKAFLSQLTTLALMALYFRPSEERGSTERTSANVIKEKSEAYTAIVRELENIPGKIEEILSNAKEVERLAVKYKRYNNFLFIGRRYGYPVALEGALKLKEVSYIHAEGCGAGEMKHGPIAMISPDFPTVAIVPQNSVAEKMYSNIEEVRSRKGPVLAIATKGDKKIGAITDDVFYIPPTIELLEPFLAIVPLQLLAYYIGIARGNNVDKPRNLAKSVTVE